MNSILPRLFFYWFISIGIIHSQQVTTATLSDISTDSDITDAEYFYYEHFIAASTMGKFTYDFSSAGDTEMTITWQAPAGKLFELNVPTDPAWNEYNELLFELYAPGIQTTGWHLGVNGTTEVTYAAGSDILPEAGESRVIIDGTAPETAQFFTGFFDLTPGATYRFTSVTMRIVIPGSFSGNLDRDITILEAAYLLEGSEASTLPEDPGTPFKLVDAEAPTSLTIDQSATLSWFATENVTYSIESTMDLADLQNNPFTETAEVTGLGAILNWSDPEPIAGSKFYKLVIKQ